MGIKGAAIATTISYIVGMNIMITTIKKEKLLSTPSRDYQLFFKFCFPILIIGLPAAFTMMLSPIVLSYINKIVSTHKKSPSLKESISDFDEEIKTYLRKNFALISQ